MSDVKIGKYCIVDEGTVIGRGSKIGNFVTIKQGVVIGFNVRIDDYCYLNGPCRVGDNSHIKARSIVAPGFVIMENVLFGGNVVTTRSKQVKADKDGEGYETTTVGSGVQVGSNATIISGSHICDNATIGAGAVVTKPIVEPGLYVGNPAKKIR